MSEGLPAMYLIVKALPEGLDRRIFKTENKCKKCGIPFGMKSTQQTLRHVCRFCYHAVCSSCSPLTALHPETYNSERICLACFTHYLKVHIDDEKIPRFRDFVKMEIENFKRRCLEGYQDQIDRERRKLEDKEKEKNFQNEISRLNLELQLRETQIMLMDLQENQDAEDNLFNNAEYQIFAKYANVMYQLGAENSRLKIELNQLKNLSANPSHNSGWMSEELQFILK